MNSFVTLSLRISNDLVERIDEHWHQQRLMSRATAIRDLLERGLSRQPHRAPQAHVAPAQQYIEQE